MSTGDIKRYYGKYRGTVINNLDFEGRGRIQASVADVNGFVPTTWALPCMPTAGLQQGVFIVPPPLANVWIEFEQGHPDHPIWSGCFWDGKPEMPLSANLVPPKTPVILMETLGKNAFILCDVPIPPMAAGGVLLRAGGSSISVDQSGITMVAPKITIIAPAIVINGVTNINNGALQVNL